VNSAVRRGLGGLVAFLHRPRRLLQQIPHHYSIGTRPTFCHLRPPRPTSARGLGFSHATSPHARSARSGLAFLMA
jgi:hypothetical protein